MPLTDYLRPRLLDPLGIGHVGWLTAPDGLELGFSGLFAGTEDAAKLGLLHLQHGRWDGAQLLPQSWVDQATRRQVDTTVMENPDWRQGYGYQLWMSRHGYRGDGAFGQFCLVLPDHDTVVATTALTEKMQAVLDACWTHLLPGLGGQAAHGTVEEGELAARLQSLRLTPGPGGPAPEQRSGWSAQEFAVARARDDERSCRTLRSARIDHEDPVLHLTLIEDDNLLRFPVGSGDWSVSIPTDRRGDEVPVAASGGWLDADRINVRVAFLETPHRMDVTCSLADGTAEGRWRHGPLHRDEIRQLHCP
jgi:hypothetical protein